MKRLTVLAAPLALAFLLAACGDSGSSGADGAMEGHGDMDGHGAAPEEGHGHEESSPVVEGAREIEVTAKDLRFSPDTIEVAAGEDVTIVFTAADVEHDLTIEDADFHVGAAGGETAKGGLRIDKPGTYTFVCTVPGHEQAGMRGTLKVTEA